MQRDNRQASGVKGIPCHTYSIPRNWPVPDTPLELPTMVVRKLDIISSDTQGQKEQGTNCRQCPPFGATQSSYLQLPQKPAGLLSLPIGFSISLCAVFAQPRGHRVPCTADPFRAGPKYSTLVCIWLQTLDTDPGRLPRGLCSCSLSLNSFFQVVP